MSRPRRPSSLLMQTLASEGSRGLSGHVLAFLSQKDVGFAALRRCSRFAQQVVAQTVMRLRKSSSTRNLRSGPDLSLKVRMGLSARKTEATLASLRDKVEPILEAPAVMIRPPAAATTLPAVSEGAVMAPAAPVSWLLGFAPGSAGKVQVPDAMERALSKIDDHDVVGEAGRQLLQSAFSLIR